MRIVGGRLKGRVLAAPGSRDIRPTSERLRESMFDILEHRYPGRIEGRRVVDLLRRIGGAGDRGPVARRAASRCSSTTARRRAPCCAPTSRRWGSGGVTRIWRADATRLGDAPAGGPFALAFLDPPYGQNLAGPALAALVAGGWLETGRALRRRGGGEGGDRRAAGPRARSTSGSMATRGSRFCGPKIRGAKSEETREPMAAWPAPPPSRRWRSRPARRRRRPTRSRRRR